MLRAYPARSALFFHVAATGPSMASVKPHLPLALNLAAVVSLGIDALAIPLQDRPPSPFLDTLGAILGVAACAAAYDDVTATLA